MKFYFIYSVNFFTTLLALRFFDTFLTIFFSGLCNRFNREDERRREIKGETRWEEEQNTHRTKYIINGKLNNKRK